MIIFWLKLLCANIFSEKKKKRVNLVSIPATVWAVMSHEQWHFIWRYEDSIESDGLNILNIIPEMSAFTICEIKLGIHSHLHPDMIFSNTGI